MLNSGDLIFVRGHDTSLVDDAIKVGESILYKHPFASCYTHVAVYIGGSTIMEAQGLRRSGKGNIGDYAGDYDIGHVRGLDYHRRVRFLQSLNKENNLPYDWPGIFWLIVKILTGYDRKYREHRMRYCTKYIGWALRQTGIRVNDETPESMALDPQISLERGR